MAAHGQRALRGARTHEQQQRIINKQENTKGADVAMPGETVAEARRKHPHPPAAYDNSTGDRTIKRGSNQETRHNKDRADDE